MTKLLLVDDDDLVRSIVRRMLEKRSFLVIDVCNGQEGIRAATLRDPDLVVCDVLLPDMDGGDVIATIRRTRPKLPAVMMTGLPDRLPPSVTALLDLHILRKPFSERELHDAVHRALRISGASEHLSQ
jgi:DNA-binding response OmpR family regulator